MPHRPASGDRDIALDAAQLVGRWTHAHEEDERGALVFRPASHSFLPSRGRRTLELDPNGGLVERGPAPTDAPTSSVGSWEVRGDDLLLHGVGGEERYRVVAAEPDRLVLEPRT